MKGNNNENMNEKPFYIMKWLSVGTKLPYVQTSKGDVEIKGYDDIDSYYSFFPELKKDHS